jgi:hypothetical protein
MELVKNRDSFRQRCEATWDLKAILAKERDQEREDERRRDFYDESDR